MNRTVIIAIISLFLISFFSGSITGMIPIKGYVILHDSTPASGLQSNTILHLRNNGITITRGKLVVPGVGIQRVPFPIYEQHKVIPDLLILSGNENISQVQDALQKRSDLIKQNSLANAKRLNAENSKCGGEYSIAETEYSAVSRGAAIARTQYLIDSCRKQKYGARDSSYPFGPINNDSVIENANITKNCGTDFNCIIIAGKTCEPSKVTRTLKKNTAGYDHTVTTYYELSTSGSEYCTLYFSTQNIVVNMDKTLLQESHDANMTTEEIQTNLQQQQDEAKKEIGKDALCRIAIVDLEDVLKKVKSDNMEFSDWDNEDCEGDYFE